LTFGYWLLFYPQERELATVLRIIDGDTLKINYHGRNESIRLIGINTPERNEEKGKQATTFVKSFLRPGSKIEIEFDFQKRDRYGRLLGYVYVDGEMLNEELIEAGYANVMTVLPNVKYQWRFLFKKAKRIKQKLWK
jgi:micrococcal nuclease